jgi:hypothetical protein
LDLVGSIAGFIPILGNVLNFTNVIEAGDKVASAIADEKDTRLKEYTNTKYGNNSFVAEYPKKELSAEEVLSLLFKSSSIDYLDATNLLSECIFSGYVNDKEFKQEQQSALKQVAAEMIQNAYSMLGYSHAAQQYYIKDFPTLTEDTATDLASYYENFSDTKSAGTALLQAIDEAFKKDGYIDETERLIIREKMMALNSTVIDFQPYNKTRDYKGEMIEATKLAMSLSEDSINKQIDGYIKDIGKEIDSYSLGADPVIDYLHKQGSDLEQEAKNTRDIKIFKATEPFYKNSSRFFNALFQDMYPSLYKKAEFTWGSMKSEDFYQDPLTDWQLANQGKADSAFTWWNYNETSISVSDDDFLSYYDDFIPKYKSIFSRDYIDIAASLLNSGNEMEKVFEQYLITIAANRHMYDYSEFGDFFEPPLSSVVQANTPVTIQMPVLFDDFWKVYRPRWPLLAQGGRATDVSIIGEVGPEWAIPERHDARTAELLNSAREASGFSWTELIASTGGLNGGGNVVSNNITYAPVIHANDARGIEDVLSKDKQLLDDWWGKRQWEMARSQWA